MDIITTDVYGKKYKVPSKRLTPSIHIYGIAVQDGKVLISPQFDGYDWPGGTLDLGETLEEALEREFYEETGLKVKPLQLLNIYTNFFHHIFKNQDFQSFLIYYLVEIVGGEISTEQFSENEKSYAKAARWATVDELRKMRHACSLDIADELLDYAESVLSHT